MSKFIDKHLPVGKCIIKLNNYTDPQTGDLCEVYYSGQFINQKANHAAANNWLFVTRNRHEASKVNKVDAEAWASKRPFYKPEIIEV